MSPIHYKRQLNVLRDVAARVNLQLEALAFALGDSNEVALVYGIPRSLRAARLVHQHNPNIVVVVIIALRPRCLLLRCCVSFP